MIPAIVLFSLLPGGALAQARPPKPLAFTHVTVIDTTGTPPRTGQSVVVVGHRIAAIGRTGEISLPVNAQVVDGTGKFLMPGLWDMHVHTHGLHYDPAIPYFALLIANGITGIRDMGSPLEYLDRIKRWRTEESQDIAARPRIVAAGPILERPGVPIAEILSRADMLVGVASATEGRQAVRMLKTHGADFIKVYNTLSRGAYFAIAAESRKQGLPFVGHVPWEINASEASNAGQKSVEHLFLVLRACSDREEETRYEGAKAIAAGQAVAYGPYLKIWLDSYSDRKAIVLFRQFRRNRTWHCPTLVNGQRVYLIAPEEIRSLNEPWLRYIPASVRVRWSDSDPMRRDSRPPEQVELSKRAFQKEIEIVGAMHRAGVELLAGTDALKPYLLPGPSLHKELELFVQAGLTPMEALQTATRNPARFLGRDRELGTVQTGKLADLVLLDADPLQDIRNTRRVHAVVLNGKLLDRAALDALLAQAEKAVSPAPSQ